MFRFSHISSRSAVAPQAGFRGIPLAAPWWRQLTGSALSEGAVRWRVRSSRQSFTGAVVCAAFRTEAKAKAFAAAWAWWCGCAVVVRRRRSAGSPVWSASVPVQWPGHSPAPQAPQPGAGIWVSDPGF